MSGDELGRLLSRALADPATGCLVWQGSRSGAGYPQMTRGHARRVYAHRRVWELARGPIPDGLQIDHLCRNRACINPEHLEPVTERENILRGTGASARNAKKMECPKGHRYDGTTAKGRRCNTCSYESNRALTQRRMALGLCAMCSEPRVTGSTRYCPKHRDYMNDYLAKRRARA